MWIQYTVYVNLGVLDVPQLFPSAPRTFQPRSTILPSVSDLASRVFDGFILLDVGVVLASPQLFGVCAVATFRLGCGVWWCAGHSSMWSVVVVF